MEHVILFALLQAMATGYATARGGRPERLTGLALLAAFLLSILVQQRLDARFGNVEWGVFAIDATLLAALLAIAWSADRFWTLWIAALQALGTGAHLVRLLDGTVIRFAYALLVAAWSYPMVLLLVLGTARHVDRLRLHGRDPDWSHGQI